MSDDTKLTKEERTFCELFVNGCAPYAGNAERCYADVFHSNRDDLLNNHKAKKLLNKKQIKEYVQELESMSMEQAVDIKRYLTANLKHIIEEASSVDVYDRKGTLLSPAALRSVAVSAAKALMEMYPVREAQVNKVDINGGGEGGHGGITFNVIVPDSKQQNG